MSHKDKKKEEYKIEEEVPKKKKPYKRKKSINKYDLEEFLDEFGEEEGDDLERDFFYFKQ